MTTEVRELLREGAAVPGAVVDVSQVIREATDRRRRRRGIATALGVVVVALASIGLVRAADGGGSSTRVAIGPRQTTDVPEGWTSVRLETGIRFAMPPSWDVYDFGATAVAEKRFSIGSARPGDGSLMAACSLGVGQTPTQPGTWVALWEYPAAGSSATLVGPGDGAVITVADRPADFRSAAAIGLTCPYAGGASSGDLGAAFAMFAFRDAGRVFLARVVTASPTGITPDLALGEQVLNTLRVSPLEPATTAPATTTSTSAPTVPAATVAPFVPSSADEQEISRLVVSWLRRQTDEEIRATFEDADAIIGAIHQGMAQKTEADLARYTGQVDAIRLSDPEHAVVDYTLLFNGQPQFGRRTGAAVKIDGLWKVSRDTECALLALGGITCPPRSNP